MKAASRATQGVLYPELEQPELPADVRGIAVTDGRCLLPFQMFRGRSVSWNGLIVAAYLDSLVGEHGAACWQTDKAIARECGICLRSAQQGVEELHTKGFLHVDRQKFRGRIRRILFLLWKVPETLPRLDRESARSCAKQSARSCAPTHVENASEGAKLCASKAHDHALPYPISNSVLSSKEETGTARVRACARERAPDPTPDPPPPEAAPPPVPEQPSPTPEPIAAPEQPSSEQIAEWESQARNPRSPQGIMARIMLAGLKQDAWGAARPAPAPHAPVPPGTYSAGKPTKGATTPTAVRAGDLADALRDPERHDSVKVLVAFCATQTSASKAQTLKFLEDTFEATRAGVLPHEPVKKAIQDSLKGHVDKKSNHLSSSLARIWRRAKTAAAEPTLASSPGDGRVVKTAPRSSPL